VAFSHAREEGWLLAYQIDGKTFSTIVVVRAIVTH
jgi:hypothetical protein